MNAPQDLPQQPVPMFSPKHFPVYMDYSATTPIDPRVVDKMLPYLREQFGNAASRSHAYGWAAEEAVEWARSEVAQLVHADPREIVFTSGATESIKKKKTEFKHQQMSSFFHFLFTPPELFPAIFSFISLFLFYESLK